MKSLPPISFPPFESLPEETRRAVVRSIVREDRWRMAGYELGALHAAATRGLRALASTRRFRRSHLLPLLISAVQSGPARGLHGIVRALTRFSRDARKLATVTRGRTELLDLSVRYARGIPQAPAYRGYWHDPARQNTVGVAVGIDFIPSPAGWWFVESNLDSALRAERTNLYDHDPIVANLVDFVASRGYERLIVVPGNTVRLDAGMLTQFEKESARRGLALTIADDKFLPGSRSQSLGLPPLTESRTFVARIRRFHTALDYLVADKSAAYRVLRSYLAESGDRSFHLPATGTLEETFRPPGNEAFPNLVYKLSEWDQGQAVVFMKLSSLEGSEEIVATAMFAARPRGAAYRFGLMFGRRGGFFQSYVKSAPAGGHLYIVRAHVLVSPVGNRFLSAHRVVAAFPLPESLPDGVVKDSRPFLVNYSAGARYETVPRDEEASVARAALGVAAGLGKALEYGYGESYPGLEAHATLEKENERTS